MQAAGLEGYFKGIVMETHAGRWFRGVFQRHRNEDPEAIEQIKLVPLIIYKIYRMNWWFVGMTLHIL